MNETVSPETLDVFFDSAPWILGLIAALNAFMIRRRGASAAYLMAACLALAAGLLVWRRAGQPMLGGVLAAVAVGCLAMDVANRKDRFLGR